MKYKITPRNEDENEISATCKKLVMSIKIVPLVLKLIMHWNEEHLTQSSVVK